MLKSLTLNSRFDKMKQVFLLLTTLSLFGCATQTIPKTSYSYDVYQYNLTKQDFAKVQKNIKSGNPSLTVLSYSKYWDLVEELEQESFFSVYKYSHISCSIDNNGNLSIKNQKTQACSYEYSDNNLHLDLSATTYKDNEISYQLQTQANNESMAQHTTSYDISKEYLLFTLSKNNKNLLFIINYNPLNIPWSNYKNTPQNLMIK